MTCAFFLTVDQGKEINHTLSPELSVDTWVYNEYAAPTDTECPPRVMPLASIQCQVARGAIKYTTPPLWITTSMDRV
jgi:hypothetical protein